MLVAFHRMDDMTREVVVESFLSLLFRTIERFAIAAALFGGQLDNCRFFLLDRLTVNNRALEQDQHHKGRSNDKPKLTNKPYAAYTVHGDNGDKLMFKASFL